MALWFYAFMTLGGQRFRSPRIDRRSKRIIYGLPLLAGAANLTLFWLGYREGNTSLQLMHASAMLGAVGALIALKFG